MTFTGLLLMAVGGVLVYCAVENISVGDFVRGNFTKRTTPLSGPGSVSNQGSSGTASNVGTALGVNSNVPGSGNLGVGAQSGTGGSPVGGPALS